jgi:hypothetical protein
MADGIGIEKLSDAVRLKMKSMNRYGNEMYLVWDVSAEARGAKR